VDGDTERVLFRVIEQVPGERGDLVRRDCARGEAEMASAVLKLLAGYERDRRL
jgi:hypothetical protein